MLFKIFGDPMKLIKIIFILFIFVLMILSAVIVYLEFPMFGKLPQGERLARIEKSPNYRSGQFHNISETPLLKTPVNSIIKFFLKNEKQLRPRRPMPTIKTNIKALDIKEDVLIWFGHSSYFIQIDGIRILIDPLFSDAPSPLTFFPRVFEGTNIYKPEDMPSIDYLIITHDHWDHLDYETVLKLKPKTKKVICPLGVGEHLEYWEFKDEQIIEMDWNEEIICNENIRIYCLPARHFSGRCLSRNKSLWASFLIKTSDFKIYAGGDSGYDAHFAEIGQKFGPIDIALLDSGQHNQQWKYVHMMPHEVIMASKDMKAKALLPGHICKICLAYHTWDEPLKKLHEMMKREKFSILTPIIGEKINLRSKNYRANNWWKKVDLQN